MPQRIIDNFAIVVIGASGTGKTTFIERAGGLANKSEFKSFKLQGLPVTLIDTRGFNNVTVSDIDILQEVRADLSTRLEGSKLGGVIYMQDISSHGRSTISRRAMSMLKDMLREKSLQNLVIVTNMWNKVKLEEGESREQELETDPFCFKPVLDNGATILRHDNTTESAHGVIQHLINNHVEAFRLQNKFVEQDAESVREFFRMGTEMEEGGSEVSGIAGGEVDSFELLRRLNEAERRLLNAQHDATHLRLEADRAWEEARRMASECSEVRHKSQGEVDELLREIERSKKDAAERIRTLTAENAELQREKAVTSLHIQRLNQDAQGKPGWMTVRIVGFKKSLGMFRRRKYEGQS